MIGSIVVSLGIAALVACSAQGSDADLSGDTPTSDPPGASLPPPSGNTSGGSETPPSTGDAGKPAKDASTPPSAPPAPDPGAVCTTGDKIYSRQCGACGKQEAICQLDDPDSGTSSGKVSDYSACHDELVGGCAPGTVVNESCGNCGHTTKTCSKYCAWSTAACLGEPLNSCPAGQIAWTVAGCGTAGTFRSRTCSDACGWGIYSACVAPAFTVAAAGTVGKTASIVVPLTKAIHTKKVTGNCGTSATLSTTDDYNVAYVKVTNPNAQAATITVWNSQASDGPVMDTLLASYAAEPHGDDALKACEKGVGDYCSTSALPCGDSKFGSLSGTTAVVVPANGSKVIAITAGNAQSSAGDVSEGTVVLNLRTDTLE